MKTMLTKLKAFLAQYDLRQEAMAGAALLAGVALLVAPVRAGFPVIDYSNLAQNIQILANTVQQVQQGVQQILALKSQVQLMQQEITSITGTRGMGNIARTGIEGQMGYWMPNGIDQMLAEYRAGTNVNGILGSRLQQIRDEFRPVNSNDILLANRRTEELQSYDRAVGTTHISRATAEQALADMNESAQRMRGLGEQIDKTEDLKAAMDLQNRMLYETIVTQQYQMRLQAMALAQKAAEQQQELTRYADGQRYFTRSSATATGQLNKF